MTAEEWRSPVPAAHVTTQRPIAIPADSIRKVDTRAFSAARPALLIVIPPALAIGLVAISFADSGL